VRRPESFEVEARVSLGCHASRINGGQVVSLGRVALPELEKQALDAVDGALLFRATDIPAIAASFVDGCEAIEGLSCCHLGAGLEITLDPGGSFTEDTRDDFPMVGGWFVALAHALERGVGGAFVWEQSSLEIRREGAELVVRDGGASDSFGIATAFPLVSFAQAILREGRILSLAFQALSAEVERRGMTTARRTELIQSSFDRDSSRFPRDPERVWAIIHDQAAETNDVYLATIARALASL
jgi:hypothetical protein